MEIERTAAFVRRYRSLTPEDRKRVANAVRQLLTNPRHPSLRAAKWDRDTWYARAGRDLRIYYEVHVGYYLLLDVGHHDVERRH